MSERSAIKMPELLVFVRAVSVGFIAAEIARLSYALGSRLAHALSQLDPLIHAAWIAAALAVCLTYAILRDTHSLTWKLGRSGRLDLLLAVLLGVWTDVLAQPGLNNLHQWAGGADPHWAAFLLAAALLLMGSALVHAFLSRRRATDQIRYFLADDAIEFEADDVLAAGEQAKYFAEMVLAGASQPGMVFGLDGPWGSGKSSFVNLAIPHWKNAAIVFRFEPLRYASDPDLSERFIRDLSSEIQKTVFVPELRPAVSRYSRLLKGKADLSFLGFKLSLEPSTETIDDLLGDIDDALHRTRRHVIVVVDDLDRLDAKTVNYVLFMIRRTFRLRKATYILCFDTEVLAGGKEEGGRAREFLEKFVTVKHSLFIDNLSLQRFLRRDWAKESQKFPAIPSDTMIRISSIVGELGDILGDSRAASYAPLVGDLRKIKRFVNAVLLLQLEKIDFVRSDFNRRDLVNLLLLHLNYPGVFRQIYAEETEGRTGSFAARRESSRDGPAFVSSSTLKELLSSCSKSEQFLLKQLFDVEELGVNDSVATANEAILSSRACFNAPPYRTLEKYLKLIVRLSAPTPRETFKLYQGTVDRILEGGVTVGEVLNEPDYLLPEGHDAHDKFWRVLVSNSFDFTQSNADDALDTLVEYLPRYSSVAQEFDRSLRQRSIYSLLMLLENAGWGRTNGRRRPNSSEYIVEISHRIFGEDKHAGQGLIARLASRDRGVLGWRDLMLFRLQCSADRRGQLFNVHSALIVHDDMSAPTSGVTNELARRGMRLFSQLVFARFRETYIDPKRNFLAEADEAFDDEFFGCLKPSVEIDGGTRDMLLKARSTTKTFVIYQLAHRQPPTGSGVCCGYYDESGSADDAGIGAAMDKYLFDVCFNPEIEEKNVYHFADYCLRNLGSGFWSGEDQDGLVPTVAGLASGLDLSAMKRYWLKHGARIRSFNLAESDRRVVTANHTALYKDHMAKVTELLDTMS